MEVQDRGSKHWMVLLLTCGLALTSIGITINASGVFYTPVSESLGVLRGTFALQSTLTLIATGVISLSVPKILKKYSFKKVLFIGVLAAGLATIGMAFSQSILLFYILGAIRGLATGLFGPVTLTMIVNGWFEKHHGLATSLVLGCSGIGGALFSPLFASLIGSIGWEKSYIVMGILMVLLCVPAILVPFTMDAREEGLLPYGYREKAPVSGEAAVRRKGKQEIVTSSFLALFVLSVLHTAVTGVPHHFPGFAQSIGYSAALGATMLSAGMVGNIISKLVIGYLSDRLGIFKANTIMIAVNVLSIFLLLAGLNAGALLVSSFLFGSVFSVAAVGITLLTRELFGVENYGKVFPVISFATNIGGALSLSIVGYIYDFTGSYTNAFLISLVIHAVDLVLLAFLARKAKARTVDTQVLEAKVK